jgi:hypothetical protein
MLKYEDILAWINTSIDYSISCPLWCLSVSYWWIQIELWSLNMANNMLHQIPEHNIESGHTCTVSCLHAWACVQIYWH